MPAPIAEDTIMLAKTNHVRLSIWTGSTGPSENGKVIHLARLLLSILRWYIAKTIDHPEIQRCSAMGKGRNPAHASLGPVFSQMIAATN